MELQARINQLVEKYATEKEDYNTPSFYIHKKRRYSKTMLSSQISSTLIDAIEDICKASGVTKSAVVEHLIYIGLINTEFD